MDTPYTEISFTLPYALPLEGEFDFDLNRPCRVTITNVGVMDQRSKAVMGIEAVGGATIKISDQYGLSHVAKVTVALAGELPPGPDMAGMIAHREDACTALNYLLDIYAMATSDYRVRHVMPDHDVLSLGSDIVTDEGRSPVGFLFGAAGQPPYPVRIRDLSDEKTRALFEQLLQMQVDVPAERQYLHDARRSFQERDFRGAIILASTALEVQWEGLLDVGMDKQGVDRKTRRKRLRTYTTPTTNKGTLACLDLGLREVFNLSLKQAQPELWAVLNGAARNLRKNVIHPKVKTPAYQETLEALVAIEHGMRWLRDQTAPAILGDDDPAKRKMTNSP